MDPLIFWSVFLSIYLYLVKLKSKWRRVLRGRSINSRKYFTLYLLFVTEVIRSGWYFKPLYCIICLLSSSHFPLVGTIISVRSVNFSCFFRQSGQQFMGAPQCGSQINTPFFQPNFVRVCENNFTLFCP